MLIRFSVSVIVVISACGSDPFFWSSQRASAESLPPLQESASGVRSAGIDRGERELDVRKRRVGCRVGMEEVPELLHAVGETRCGARVVAASIDNDGANRQPQPCRVLACLVEVEAAGSDHDHVWPFLDHVLPAGW